MGRRRRRSTGESLHCCVRCRVVEARLEMMSRLAGAGDRYEMGSWTELVGMEENGHRRIGTRVGNAHQQCQQSLSLDLAVPRDQSHWIPKLDILNL